MKRRFKKMFLLGFKQFQDPYYQGFAAQMSFFFVLSLVPTIVVLSQFFGILNVPVDSLEEWFGQYMENSGMASVIIPLLEYRPATTNNIVMILMALWAASRAQFSMMRIANYTYSSGRTTGNFWSERIRSLKTMLLTLFTWVFVAIILVYGKMILTIIFGKIFEGTLINTFWTFLRWPLASALYFLMVSYNYYVLPIEKTSYRKILPGSIFGAIAMLVVTIFYSIYVDYISNYSIIYGSLASIVAVLFWFYFISWALCLGIVFNKVYDDTRQEGDNNVKYN